MGKTELKKEVEHLLKDLPEDADWDDLMYKIYVRQSIEQGLKDSEEGLRLLVQRKKQENIKNLRGKLQWRGNLEQLRTDEK